MNQKNGSTSLRKHPILLLDRSREMSIAISEKADINLGLNSDYNFSNFIEGKCNMMARSAAILVANNPGQTVFNPLIIYGESGIGKTHLAHSIGNLSKERFPEKNLLILNAKKLQNQYIQSLRNNKVEDFLLFYELIDVLILDDIHEIEYNKSLQDSLIRIFNRHGRRGGQLILTCDKITKELQDFEKSFLSWFKGGFRVTLHKPDYDTKLAILKKKSLDAQIHLPEEIFEFMAMKASIDIRELESILISINPDSSDYKTDSTLDVVKHLIGRQPGSNRPLFTIDYIQKNVCQYYKVPLDKMLGRARTKEIVQARQVSMFFSKRFTKATVTSIGLRTGERDHATVLYACKTVDKHIKENIQFRDQIKVLEKNLIFSIFKKDNE